MKFERIGPDDVEVVRLDLTVIEAAALKRCLDKVPTGAGRTSVEHGVCVELRKALERYS